MEEKSLWRFLGFQILWGSAYTGSPCVYSEELPLIKTRFLFKDFSFFDPCLSSHTLQHWGGV